MLFLISPAKSLDFDTPLPARLPHTVPDFLDQSALLISVLREKSQRDVAELMDLSESLAALNVARYQAWTPECTPRTARQAAFAFNGDVYGGLDAPTLARADLHWAQKHLGILSGLYGLLRPLDRIQPHRLEMSTALGNPRGRNLYQFWGERIAQALNTRLQDARTPVVVNLASQEYFKAVSTAQLHARVVECVFEERRPNGQYQIISFHAKRARGLMARFAITQRIASVRRLCEFDAEGYAYTSTVSTDARLVFRRDPR